MKRGHGRLYEARIRREKRDEEPREKNDHKPCKCRINESEKEREADTASYSVVLSGTVIKAHDRGGAARDRMYGNTHDVPYGTYDSHDTYICACTDRIKSLITYSLCGGICKLHDKSRESDRAYAYYYFGFKDHIFTIDPELRLLSRKEDKYPD